jgi:tetratricopeptide (TPR) repeat protein
LSNTIHPLSQRVSPFLPEVFELLQTLKPLLTKQQYSLALQLLQTHQQNFPEPAPSPSLLFIRAQLAIQQKNFNLAERDLNTALAELPDIVRGHQGLAMLFLAQQQWDKAEQAHTTTISLGGGTAELYGQLAYLHLRKHNSWAASAAYQQALMLKPDNIYYQEGLLSALLQNKQFASANSLLERILITQPDKTSLWLRRANIALDRKDYVTAISSLEAAIRLGDSSADNIRVAVQLHIQQGNYPRATQLLSNSIRKGGWQMQQISPVLNWLGREQQWRYVDELLNTLKPQLASLSEDQRSLFYLHSGQLARTRGNLNKAEQAYSKAVKANPNNGEALIAHAQVLTEQNKATRAELLYTRAQTINSVREQALLAQAQLFIDRADYASALDLLRTAYQEYPDNRGLEKNIETLVHIVQSAG